MEFGIFVFLVLAVIWVYQFAGFMLLDDRAFPGTYDKLIWGAAFIFFFAVTPFAFMCWKMSYVAYLGGDQERK